MFPDGVKLVTLTLRAPAHHEYDEEKEQNEFLIKLLILDVLIARH